MFLDNSRCYVLSIQGFISGEEDPLLLKHEIKNLDGKIYLSAGIILDEESRSQIEQVITNKPNKDKFELLPDNLIGKSDSMVLLYSDKSIREFWITVNGLDKKIKAHVPSLVFKVSKRGKISVAAYKGSGRPSLDTILYNAPFGNINDAGHLCIGGNVLKWPIQSLDDVVNMFFGSPFNEIQMIGGVKGVMTMINLEDFWLQVRKRKKFDETKLLNMKNYFGEQVTLKEWTE
jgi:PRTRC genetic system protein B